MSPNVFCNNKELTAGRDCCCPLQLRDVLDPILSLHLGPGSPQPQRECLIPCHAREAPLVPNCTPYLLWVKRVWSIFSVFFLHMCLIDWAACFCLRSRLLGALVKVTPSKGQVDVLGPPSGALVQETIHPRPSLLQLLGCERHLLGHLAPMVAIPVQSPGYGPRCGLQFQFPPDVLACAEPLFPSHLDKVHHLLFLPGCDQVLPTIFPISASTIVIHGHGNTFCSSS